MPSTMVIDRSGKVRYVHRGYQDGYEDTYDQQIRELLKER
jgi:peroxiredoxin